MSAVPTFSDFLLATKTHKLTSAREILNDAVKNTYFVAESLEGRDGKEFVRTGPSIKDTITLTEGGSFEFYNPNPTFNPVDRDVLLDIEVSWRFAKTDYAFSDEIIALNEGNPEDIFVDLKFSKRQTANTDMWNGMEDATWAVPDEDTMEDGNGTSPPAFPIPAFVCEGGQSFDGTWSTLMGVNPATEERWRNKLREYDPTNPLDETDGLLAAFDDIFLDVKFEAPATAQEYMENDRLRKMKVATNRDGLNLYKRILRAANDSLISPQDPSYNAPVYSGMPMKYVSTLDTAALDPVNGTAYPATKPRFFWLNLLYLFPILHAKGYMEQIGPIPGGIQQPFSHAVYFRTWYNWFCRSRQRQGIVIPSS